MVENIKRTDTGDFKSHNNNNNNNNYDNYDNYNSPVSLDFSDFKGLSSNFTEFQTSVMSEIRTNLMAESTGRKFTKQEIRKILNYPKENHKQIRQASLYLATASSHYMRLMFYMSSMLTLDNILTPYNIEKSDVVKTPFKINYNKANNYIQNFNIKHELSQILLTMMIEDIYFGYERTTSSSFMLQRLPTDRCRLTGKEDGMFTFDFDFSYFSGNEDLLLNYDNEFTALYKKYKRTNQPWQPLNTKKSVCFKFREDLFYPLPPFVSIFEDLIGLEDLKDLEDARNKLENFKLLLQKIPFKKDPRSERDFLIGADSVKMFHNNIKSVLPSQIGLISTPMEIEDYSFEPKNNRIKESVSEAEERIFSSAGVSSGLFNSGNKSAVALNRAIQTDEAMMFGVLRQFERFFNKRLKQNTTSTYQFKLIFPDLTVYNREDQLDNYLKTAQYGFPKSLVACAMGMNTSDLVGMSIMENEFLDLQEHLQPLQSSHTQNGEDSEDRGREEENTSKLSDKGQETRDSGSNDERDASK